MDSVEPIELMLTEPLKINHAIQFRMYVSKYIKYERIECGISYYILKHLDKANLLLHLH